jgi:hypothetical protein
MTALPPKPPHNFFPLRFSLPLAPSDADRHRMIEMEAYRRAECRNFTAGHAIDDWLAAEAEVDARLAYARRLAGVTAS